MHFLNRTMVIVHIQYYLILVYWSNKIAEMKKKSSFSCTTDVSGRTQIRNILYAMFPLTETYINVLERANQSLKMNMTENLIWVMARRPTYLRDLELINKDTLSKYKRSIMIRRT